MEERGGSVSVCACVCVRACACVCVCLCVCARMNAFMSGYIYVQGTIVLKSLHELE